MLQLRVSERLVATYPQASEGELTRLRGGIVSARSLLRAAVALDLGRHLRLSPAEEAVGGREKQRLLANTMEAVIAALHQDGGYDAAAAVIDRLVVAPGLQHYPLGAVNEFGFKSALQERAHALGLPLPVYRMLETSGPEHDRRFTVEVMLTDGTLGAGSGSSKKDAEQQAAAAALEALSRKPGL